MSQPGQLSHGIPPRAPAFELSRRISDLEAQIRQSQAALTQAIQMLTARVVTAVVNVPLLAAQVNSTSVVYTWPTPFTNVPVVSANSVVNTIIDARVLAVTTTSITLQTFWSDQGGGHSAASSVDVHVIAIAV